MTGYTKLFSSILTSTIWCADSDTKVIWITLLASANRKGIVEGTVPGLAKLASVPVDKTRQALETLMQPDPESRTKDKNGSRIEVVNGGWRVVNYEKYRSLHPVDEVREYERLRKQNYRANTAVRDKVGQSHTAESICSPGQFGTKEDLSKGGAGGINGTQRDKPKIRLKRCPVPGCPNMAPLGEIYCCNVHEEWAQNELKRGKA